jgi:glycosyltransferase involved in cell wall biosynthesis
LNISIIIPTYNYAAYIQQAIRSVFHQACVPGKVEVIVVDDGSTDHTAELMHGLQQVNNNLHYHVQPNAGKASATRKGIELATGDIVCMLDADDWFLPGKLETISNIFVQYTHVVHVASPARIFWQNGSREPVDEPIPPALLGREMNGTELLKTFYKRNMLFGGGSTFAARASVLRQMPWSDAIDMYTDEWLLLSTLQQGNSYFLKEPLSVWRIHEKNYSGRGGESLKNKNNRLRQSSTAIVEMMQQHGYPQWLQDAYALKHATRLEHWKETEGKKTIGDRWAFLRNILLCGRYPPRMLWAYRAYMRLFR